MQKVEIIGRLISVQVHRVCFALVLFHALLGILLLGVRDSRQKRAGLQNGYIARTSTVQRLVADTKIGGGVPRC